MLPWSRRNMSLRLGQNKGEKEKYQQTRPDCITRRPA